MKLEEVKKYSDPDVVFRKANKLFDEPFEFNISTRKNKKYMIKGDFTDNKWVHFGQMLYEDYTKHKDKERREKFLNRNRSWANKDKGSPAYLSYYLLW